VCNVSPVSYTPKLKSHIVPNVYKASKDLTWETEKTIWIGMAHITPPNLNASTLVLENKTLT
jgi:hypothetical protein